MNQFMIGQYGRFDEEKQIRDFRSSFWGIEACMMESEKDVQRIVRWKQESGAKVGIHFPLRSGQWEHRDPQYLSNDEEIRQASYAYMETDFRYAAKVNPEYILIHYPKPVALDKHVDWIGWNWKFGHPSEYLFIESMEERIFQQRSETFFKWFSLRAKKYGFRPVIELDAIPLYLSESEFFIELLKAYPDVEICVDIGRLHLQDSIDERFDSFRFLRKIMPWVTEVHLWNIQVTDRVAHSHYPALPSLDPKDGWADVERYFEILAEAKWPVRILFEHDSSCISEAELESCYQWIRKLKRLGPENKS